MDKLQTYNEWASQHYNRDGSNFVSGELAESGYAWYLEKQLGRTPTIQEMKQHGEISELCGGA